MKKFAAAAALILAACSSLPSQLASPEVSVADFSFSRLGLFEQEYVLKLRLHNPNNVALPVDQLVYELAVAGQRIATGSSVAPVTVPANGSAVLSLSGAGQFGSLLRELAGAAGRGSPVPYALSGRIKIKNFPVELPFDKRGEYAPGR